MSQRCTICGTEFSTKRRPGLYCSSACKQKGYRRRKNEQRLLDAEARRESEVEKHRNAWLEFLMSSGSLSRRQAERTFVALQSIGRVDGEPWEQLTID